MDTLGPNLQCHTRFPEPNLANQLLKGVGRDLRNHLINEQETQGDKWGLLNEQTGI